MKIYILKIDLKALRNSFSPWFHR